MQPLLVAYASAEGQTRKIAEFIAERLRIRGHRVDLVDTATPAAQAVIPVYQGAILGGPVHQNKHPAALVDFAKRYHAWLSALPCAVFSVSLGAALEDMESRIEVQRLLYDFVDDAALNPVATCCIAGALKYTQYDYFKRLVMRMIARQRGQSTDTSKDHEYTDWDGIEVFIDEFLAAARIPVAARAA
ncbi:MAG: flavodoxin domain-containing protein [Burkholderiaceae bacterium]